MTSPHGLLKKAKDKSHGSRFKVWFEQAQFDYKATIHSREDSFFEWSCYQAEQAVEKALKALILHGGWYPPRTHKLSVLIGLSNNINKEFRNTKFVFRNLEVFTYISRYPFLVPNEDRAPHEFITQDDSDRCIHESGVIMDIISKLLEIPNDDDYQDVEKIEAIDLQNRINYVKEKIVEEFAPEKIVLYGSYGRGEERLSTLDLLVIGDTDLNYFDRIHKIREVTKGGLPVVQPVMYTAAEFESLEDIDGYVKNALEEGQVLYER